MSASITVDCDATQYTQLTASTTAALIVYNPPGSAARLGLYVGPTVPSAATPARLELQPDEGFQRPANLTGHVWARVISGGPDASVVVIE